MTATTFQSKCRLTEIGQLLYENLKTKFESTRTSICYHFRYTHHVHLIYYRDTTFQFYKGFFSDTGAMDKICNK